jgi:hypothetical protein
MVSIASALRRIKDDLPGELSSLHVHELCRASGHRWRDRVLDPVTTLRLLMLQVLHGNAACVHLPRLSGLRFSVAAYCVARARLPLEVIRRVALSVAQRLRDSSAGVGLWHGRRLWHIDGSSFSMPDTPELQRRFGQHGSQKRGCGFPVAHLLVMVDAATGLIGDLIASPLRTHDLRHASGLHGGLRPGDVLIGDRGFCSFAHLALLLKADLHAVFRMHQRQVVDFAPRRVHHAAGGRRRKGRPTSRWRASLGIADQLVEWVRPARWPAWMSEAEFQTLPKSIVVRELRYGVKRRGFRSRQVTLVTTLLEADAYPADALAEVYGGRWGIETNLRHLKTTMKMDVLRCKSEDGVMKELWAFALVYNLVRGVMLQAATRQRVAPGRISFIDALRWMCHAKPGEPPPPLIVNPHRPGRVQPRVIKRRKDRFTYMTRPRDELQQRLLGPRSAVTR